MIDDKSKQAKKVIKKIAIDKTLPTDKFERLAAVSSFEGDNLNKNLLKDIDCLIVRSVTKVNRTLLSGTNVKWVGSATSGTNHIDKNYLATYNIGFANSEGANANSVAEYVIAAVLLDCIGGVKMNTPLKNVDQLSIAIIGVGNIGSKLHTMCKALGMTVYAIDPPCANNNKDKDVEKITFHSPQDVFNADVISWHVPLTKAPTPHPTYRLAEKSFFDAIFVQNKNPLIINTSRGAVFCERCFTSALEKKKIRSVVDVWKKEPYLNFKLLSRVDVATPHIAGYSKDAKDNAISIIYQQLISWLNHNKILIDTKFPITAQTPRPIFIDKNFFINTLSSIVPHHAAHARWQSPLTLTQMLAAIVLTAHRLHESNKHFKNFLLQHQDNPHQTFESERIQHQHRAEWRHFKIIFDKKYEASLTSSLVKRSKQKDVLIELKKKLITLGFQV